MCIPQPMRASCCVVAVAKPPVGHRCRAPWPRTAVPGLASAPSSCACVTGVGVAVCVPSATQTPAGQHWPQRLRGTSGTHTCTHARAGDKSHRVPGSPPVSRCTAGGSQSSSRSRCLPAGQLVFHGGAVSTQRGELLPAQTWSCPQGQNWAKGRGVGQSPLLGLG